MLNGQGYKNVGNKEENKTRALPRQFDQMGDFLTIPEVAEYLRLEPITVYRLIKQKKLKAIKLLPKKLLIPKESILALLRNSEMSKQAA